ncbi:MAG: lipoate-protein ligase B [Micavibrio sp. TMED27]|nr:lipoate-protein ligase B [Micavibrio sp.]OUT89929.1 MAG: lipoate-protein ligase B [Micavibrio sp. TMED27]
MEWKISENLVDYRAALEFMDERVSAIHKDGGNDLVWFLQHSALYTAGTSAKAHDLLDQRFPVYEAGRGGEHTYHGPGQRIAYVMLDLKKRQKTPDIRDYIWRLEEWIIRTLSEFGVVGERRSGRVGIWVVRDDGREEKIAAIGVRVRHWITMHGIALNVEPDLSHFGGIVPCGIREHGVTSLRALGVDATMEDVDAALRHQFKSVFGES